jgi:hypothetical protein
MSFSRLSGQMLALMQAVEGADAMPTTQAVAASAELQKALAALGEKWERVKTEGVKTLNERLREAKLQEIRIEP